MDETYRAQIVGQIEGLQLALSMLNSRPNAHAFSVAKEVETALDSLRGELLDAAGMRRPSAIAATAN